MAVSFIFIFLVNALKQLYQAALICKGKDGACMVDELGKVAPVEELGFERFNKRIAQLRGDIFEFDGTNSVIVSLHGHKRLNYASRLGASFAQQTYGRRKRSVYKSSSAD